MGAFGDGIKKRVVIGGIYLVAGGVTEEVWMQLRFRIVYFFWVNVGLRHGMDAMEAKRWIY